MSSTDKGLTAHLRSPMNVPQPPLIPAGQQIVVGIDGSPQSLRALTYAAKRADVTGEPVLAVLAYQDTRFSAGGSLGTNCDDIDAEPALHAQKQAERLVAPCAHAYPQVEFRATAVLGRPARVLQRLTDDASLLVVGTRGHAPIRQTVLGSVSRNVVRRASCPVIVVR